MQSGWSRMDGLEIGNADQLIASGASGDSRGGDGPPHALDDPGRTRSA
jgi:hypothetical protein